MTFVSYAQNFEDVLLWRALQTIGPGFYIDVGAAHPDADSVTRALYDRGWSGINIEPVESSATRLRAARPRDTTLQIALGEAPGRHPFFVVEGADTGLSTTTDAELSRFEKQGFTVNRTEISMETLAAICRRHAPGPIHVLKIDVEGAERAVLAGGDFEAFRPWIVLVEVTAPMSTLETHLEWEPMLLSARYEFVWFDGLNRFYVAAEHADALSRHFRTPPNVFDDFVRASDTQWATRIGRAEALQAEAALRARVAEERGDRLALRLAADSAVLNEQAAHRAKQAAEWQARSEEMERDRDRIATVLNDTAIWAQSLEQRVIAGEQEIRDVQARLEATCTSTSWRVTAPLRRTARLVSRLRPRDPSAATAIIAHAQVAAPGAALEPPAPPRPARQPVQAPMRTVHQFHAGSSTGDAITTAMLLTRRLLRGAGYRSDIFVAHRDPALEDELRLIDELPQHDRYVLIVRHSMGHRCLQQLLALSARKVLIYHNITPPQHLGHPGLRDDARLGRDQLRLLQPQIEAALADSEYNALELRRLGFDPVQVCPILIEPATLAQQGQSIAPPGGRPFTILFVGRIIESKGSFR